MLSTSTDERRDIVVKVMDRLREDDFRRLRTYLASAAESPTGTFGRWLGAVTIRVALDHVRTHAEYTGRGAAHEGARWMKRAPLERHQATGACGQARSDDTACAHLVLARAEHFLRPDQRAALLLWLRGHDAHEIAQSLDLTTAEDADRLVRSALKRIRDRYREPTQEEAPAAIEEGGALELVP